METILSVLTPETFLFLGKGLLLTLRISLIVIVGSILWGSVLGLARNYGAAPIRKISGFYIEMFRNTPLLIWVMGCSVLIPMGKMLDRATLALTLYTASVVAEIVRGGLNSIATGQFEAAKSQGFTFMQTLWYIILPQCYIRIVPSLLSQVVTTIKDTSFLAGLGILELMRSGVVLLGRYVATVQSFTIYALIALIYFAVCFALSCSVRALQARITKAM